MQDRLWIVGHLQCKQADADRYFGRQKNRSGKRGIRLRLERLEPDEPVHGMRVAVTLSRPGSHGLEQVEHA